MKNISNIEDANMFLKDKFVPWYNGRFAVIPKSNNNCHRALDISTTAKLSGIFSKHYVRGINNDFTIQYQTKWYQLKQIQPLTVYKTDKVNSSPIVLTEHKSNWIPPADHPWRQFSYA